MFKKFRRAIAGTTSVAVVAGMVATGAVTGVVATATPAAAAIPTPGDNQAIISVKVGGVRPTQDATPTGRSGVKLELFNDNSGSVGAWARPQGSYAPRTAAETATSRWIRQG